MNMYTIMKKVLSQADLFPIIKKLHVRIMALPLILFLLLLSGCPPIPESVSTPTFSKTGGTFIDSVDVTLSCTTYGAEIRYTIDGSIPSENHGTVITSNSSVNIISTTTLQVIAYKNNMISSGIASEDYNIKPRGIVSTPTFSQKGGTFTGSVDVTISCATTGATIRYTTDGSIPSKNHGTVITTGSSINITESTTLKAIAYKDGLITSSITSEYYQIDHGVSTPTFSPTGGTFTGSVDVTISCTTTDATILYTTDGSIPSENHGTVITSDSSVNITTSTILKAIAYKDGMSTSDIISEYYQITPPSTVSTPTFTPEGGTFTGSVDVTISCTTTDATILYTTDGSIPSENHGTVITSGSSINITTSTTLKAIAYKDGLITSSVTSEYYQIDHEVSPLTFSPTGGTLTGSVDITISCTTTGATIRYTTDGSIPSENHGTVITSNSSVNITTSTTLKAIAYKDGMATSDIISEYYQIKSRVSTPSFSPAGGTYIDSVDVTISCATTGTTIRYTTDGSIPSENHGTVITSNSSVNITESTTLKAIAYKDGMTTSDIISEYYQIKSRVSTPTFSPEGEPFTDSVDVTISCITTDATIRYTIDGSTPTETNGTVITSGSSVNITTSTTLKAIAYKDGMSTSSIIHTTCTSLVPLAPPNFIASENLEEIHFKWDSVESADGMVIECSSSLDFQITVFNIDINSNITEVTKSGLIAGDIFYSRIKAYNQYGDSEWTILQDSITIPEKMSGTVWLSNSAAGDPVSITNNPNFYLISNIINAIEMRMLYEGSWGSWFDYAESIGDNFPTGDGEKGFNIEYKDLYGNTVLLSTSLILDQTPPSGSFTASIIDETNIVQFTCYPSEDISTVSFGFYKTEGFGLVFNQLYAEVFQTTISEEGDYTATLRFIDVAGNEGEFMEKYVNYTPMQLPTPPNIDRIFDKDIEEITGGNGNGVANIGEDIRLRFKVENKGGETAYNVESHLNLYSADKEYCYIYSNHVVDNLSNIDGDGDWSRAEHTIIVEGMPLDSYLDFVCRITWNDSTGNTYSKTFDADDGLRIRIFP